MAKSLNRVSLLGNVGKDAESRSAGSGTVVSFSIATSRRWKDPASGDWKEETDWHNVVSWRAENIAQYITKGSRVMVEGRLRTRNYEKDGQKHYVTEVIAEDIYLLGAKGEESQPARGTSATKSSAAIDDDDIPF